jgi:hypothetical protein
MRGHKVLLNMDLAARYGVTTKRFNEYVRRNKARFPLDFMFQRAQEEWDSLRSQFGTLKTARGQHRKYLPYAFTEHGAIMAATILNSPRATEVSVYVVRAFVRLREMLAAAQACYSRRSSFAAVAPSIRSRSASFSAARRTTVPTGSVSPMSKQ